MMLSIILPVYNEEKNIPYIKKALFPYLKEYSHELIFVDDGSTDNTVSEIKRLKYPYAKILVHETNKGMGAAIRTAIPECKGMYTITMDSDMTFHPKYIPRLLEKIKEADCVIGSPNLYGYGGVPLYRIFLSKSVNLLYSMLLRKKISAVSPILRIYKTKQLQKLDLESNKFEINAEILAKLIMQKKKIIEIPAKLTTRKYGKSKLNNLKEIRNHLKLMYKMIWWLR